MTDISQAKPALSADLILRAIVPFMARTICVEGRAETEMCADPCPWCLHEARLELQALANEQKGEPTDEEILELFGGIAPEIVRTPRLETYLKRSLEYIAREEHQP